MQPIADGLAVSADLTAALPLGKNALREGLAKIVIRNAGEFYSTSGISFADGVLTFDHKPQTNIGNGEERAKGLIRVLESGL